jgi:hypothetical protein
MLINDVNGPKIGLWVSVIGPLCFVAVAALLAVLL